jgi:hypothetical protein
MNTAVFHVVAVANALLLVLPAGWCNQLSRPDRAVTAPVQAVCCHTSSHAAPSLPRPSAPVVPCCCSQAVVAPEKVVAQADDTQADHFGQALPAFLTDFGGPEGASRFARPVVGPPSAALRLHALLCVWRC